MPNYGSTDSVQFGVLPETTEGTLEPTTAYELLLSSGVNPEATSNIIPDPTIAGTGESVDARTNLRGFNNSTPHVLRYADLQIPIRAQLRQNAWPAAVTVTGTTNIDSVPAGTHNDGSTGPQYLATLTTTLFDTLIAYDSATANGAEYLMMYVSGAAIGDNNGYRRIKEVWKDGTQSYIDIDPAYHAGAAGAYGAPLQAATGESLVIRVGSAARNRGGGGTGDKSWSHKIYYSDIDLYQCGFGMVPNDLTFNWTGKEGASIDVSWIGRGLVELTGTDPTVPGGDSFVDNNVSNQMMIGADDLVGCAIWTAGTPNIIALGSSFITQFSYTLAGQCAAITNVSGTSTVTGVRRGKHMGTGSMGWLLASGAEEIVALGSQTNNEKGGFDAIFQDANSQAFVFGALNNEFGHTAAGAGAENNDVSGTLDFTGSRKTNTSRTVIFQEIDIS